ncbi:MAG: helicase-related protein [Candidatus Hadarchaeum sp.]|uniref:helicase-related protein n=1 Tax=Candidatus Hadarchaeum sp. TaxID=2883567 RepID=UPI003D0A1C7A
MSVVNPLVRAEALEARAYQLRIAEEAIKRNTLVVLPTALGKTVIAALVAAHFLYNYRDLKVLVMAPTRPLVLQHRDTFLRLLKLRPDDVQVLTGKYDPEYRLQAWQGKSRIYFATPQVVNNDHSLGMSLKDFSLLIFDECHRARKNYAYTRVAQAYISEAPYPMILGLTASPGADREKIEEISKALYIEHIEARTEEDEDVSPYVNPVAVEWKLVRLPESHRAVERTIRRMLDDRLQRLSAMGVIRKNPKYIFRSDLLEAGEALRVRLEQTPSPEERGPLFAALVLQSSALTLYHALELLESQGPQTLKLFLERIKSSGKAGHRAIVSELVFNGVYRVLESSDLEDHPKVEALEKLVLEQLSSNPSSRIIVFTQYRDTSAYLAARLSKLGVTVVRFVGQADRGQDLGLTQDQQSLLLDRFRSGDIKVLVATSIGEEGLDIPSVDLVVFYEPVPSEIRYIQRKGRTGRRSFGRVVILATEGTLDVNYLVASRRMAERMKKMVKELNSELHPIIRLGPAPEKKPIPADWIARAELPPSSPETAATTFEAELESVEKERRAKFNRELRETARRVLNSVLTAGKNGLPFEELCTELEEEGRNPVAIRSAVERLRAEGQLMKKEGRLFPAGVEAEIPGARRHVFEVLRVQLGEAILRVDDSFNAILLSADYNGPRELLRRGNRFSAISEIYENDKARHVRIYAVEELSD